MGRCVSSDIHNVLLIPTSCPLESFIYCERPISSSPSSLCVRLSVGGALLWSDCTNVAILLLQKMTANKTMKTTIHGKYSSSAWRIFIVGGCGVYILYCNKKNQNMGSGRDISSHGRTRFPREALHMGQWNISVSWRGDSRSTHR